MWTSLFSLSCVHSATSSSLPPVCRVLCSCCIIMSRTFPAPQWHWILEKKIAHTTLNNLCFTCGVSTPSTCTAELLLVPSSYEADNKIWNNFSDHRHRFKMFPISSTSRNTTILPQIDVESSVCLQIRQVLCDLPML